MECVTYVKRMKKKKEGENKSTKWEKSRDRYMALNIRKKQLLGSGRNSAL